MPSKYTSVQERFWAKVDKSDDCWIWTARRHPEGYGYFSHQGKSVRAHRFCWEMVNGPIPDGMIVCHRCDHPWCVRPDHLFVSTQRDNVLDMQRKGRWHTPFARLTPELTKELQEMLVDNPAAYQAIAEMLGVSVDDVHSFVAGVDK